MSIFTETEGLDADDPILGLAAAFRLEKRPEKVNLAIGTYQDAQGDSWVLPSVLEAEKQLAALHLDKEYLPIDGDPLFLQSVTELLLGKALYKEVSDKAVTVQTIGGTSALRLGADYLRFAKERSIYMSEPTWPNHPNLCKQARLNVASYPYFNAVTKTLDFDAFYDSLKNMPEGSAVLLHACCHNPTGIDLSSSQWQLVLTRMQQYKLLPFFDIAYQGFAENLDHDAQGIRYAVKQGMECLIANSFSKNFGLYGERVGTLTALCSTSESANRVRKQLKTLIRRCFSSSPLHGERIVTTILNSPQLRAQWEEELESMRLRISSMRTQFLKELQRKSGQDLSFLESQKGLFSYGWLSKPQVERLKKEFAIYLPDNGRLTIPGLTQANLHSVVDALVTVTT